MKENDGIRLPRRQPARDLMAACRELDAAGAKYVVVGGMTLLQQGFSRPAEEMDLHVQCSVLNRQAVLPPLEMSIG